MTTTNPYASTDPAVIAFIASQNSARPINSTDPAMPQQDQNGVAGTTTDNVVGLSSIAAGAAEIDLGSGFNTLILTGAHSTSASTGGAADSFSFNVDGAGTMTLLDNNTGQSETITGPSYVIFNDAARGTDSNGNPDFSSIYFIGDANQSEIVRLYTAALGRQPDLGGVEYYAKQLAAGTTFTQIADEFMSSPEFAGRYGSNVSDTTFVTNLYENVLHRAPAASELAYYVAALANQEAGSVVNSANPVLWTREIELLNFTNSPEDQTDTSGFVINTANGGYADQNVLLSPSTVLSTAASSGIVNTTLINPADINSSTNLAQDFNGGPLHGGGSVTLVGAGATTAAGTAQVTGLTIGGTGVVAYLSDAVNYGGMAGQGDVLYGAANGGSNISLAGTLVSGTNGGSVYLYGSGNIIFGGLGSPTGAPPPITDIFGFQSGDYLQPSVGTPNITQIYSPSASSPLNGATIPFLANGVYQTAAIYVGRVADDSAASMAAAANAVYKVGDVTSESAVFIGEDPAGNAVLYHWTFGDYNHSGQVQAGAFTGGEVLIGLPPSSLSAAGYHGLT